MKKFLSKKLWGIPLIVILVAVLAVGAVAAQGFTPISNLWTSPEVAVTNPPTVPPQIPLVISSTWTNNDSSVSGSNFDFPVTLCNLSDSGSPDYTHVNVDIKIWNATNDIDPTDLTLSYNAGTDATPNWQVIPTTAVNSAGIKLETTFGSDDGFTVAAGYSVTTQFRVVFNKAGTYQASAQAQTH